MISSILSMQFKERKRIFVMLMLVNLFSALNFLCLGHPSSAAIDLFGDVQMVINDRFEKKGKEIPKGLVVFYILATIAIGLLVMTTKIDLIVIVAAVMFCWTVLEKNEQTIRKLWLVVLTLYIIYDIFVGAYVFAVSSSLSLASTIIAMIRYKKTS